MSILITILEVVVRPVFRDAVVGLCSSKFSKKVSSLDHVGRETSIVLNYFCYAQNNTKIVFRSFRFRAVSGGGGEDYQMRGSKLKHMALNQ